MTFTYYIQPKLSIEGSLEFSDGGSGLDVNSGSGSGTQISRKEPTFKEATISAKTCVFLYHGYDIVGEIYPWYQFRSICVSWHGIKVQ